MTDTDATLAIGRMNSLQVIKSSPYGLFVDGYEHGEILLPKRFAPDDVEPGDWLDLFVYADSEDRLIATTEHPKVMVGEVARLKAVSVNDTGAFLDWGLPKDLFVPFAEQSVRMREGNAYVVYVYVDKYNDRILASPRLSRFLPEVSSHYRHGQQVDALVCARSDLGFKCVINGECLALLHHSDVFQTIKPGHRINAWIKRVREDGRIDLGLSAPGQNTSDELEALILAYLEERGGAAPLGDKSPPEDIYQAFRTSKKNFKRALSRLYKARKIQITDSGIELA